MAESRCAGVARCPAHREKLMSSNQANIDELLQNIPIADIAANFGVDEATAQRAVTQALPGLLGGMAVNASHDDGAQQLSSALKKHEGAKFKGIESVDTADGKKIVKHVLGDKDQQVAQLLGGEGQGDLGGLIQKLLPVLAPIVMAFLANQLGGGNKGASDTGGGIGDLLGGLLGGGSNSSAQSSGGGLGDLLGGLLGGGSSNKSGGGLGDLLGGLLGGK